MNHLKTYPAHLALYLIGAIDFVSQLPSMGPLAPYAPWITAAGAVGAALHHAYQTGAASTVAQAAVGAVTSGGAIVKALFLGLCLSAVLGASMLTGCATLPTPTQDAAIATAVSVATGFAIQQKDTDPKVWAGRAQQIKLIALELQAVNNAGDATLATLAADLQPQIAKLGPADVLAVNSLVAALTPLLNQQITNNPRVGNTKVAVGTILTAVLTTCAAFGV